MSFSEFVLLVDDVDKAQFDQTVGRFNSVLDITSQYKLETDNKSYWIVQIEATTSGRTSKELCNFVHNYLPFVCLHQHGTSYILVNNALEFKVMLNNLFTQEDKALFVYNMLSIEERYACALHTSVKINTIETYYLTHYEDYCTYLLLFDRACTQLFSANPEIMLEEVSTGEVNKINILEGLENYAFHIAILK